MKKKLLFGALGALCLSAGVFTVTSLSATGRTSNLAIDNVEALASCEIRKGDKIVYQCDGDQGICQKSQYGYTLQCSGKLVKDE